MTKSITNVWYWYLLVPVQHFCHCWRHYWNFLVPHVEQSVIVPEFQGHSGTSALKAAISFSKTRCNHKGANQVINQGTNLPALSEMVLHPSLLTILWTFPTFSSVGPVEGWPESLQSWMKVSPCFQWQNHSEDCSAHGNVTKSCFEHFMCFGCSFPPPQVQSKT